MRYEIRLVDLSSIFLESDLAIDELIDGLCNITNRKDLYIIKTEDGENIWIPQKSIVYVKQYLTKI